MSGYAKINGKQLPFDTINNIGLILGGTWFVSGEAVNNLDRKSVNRALEPLHDGDGVEFEIEENEDNTYHGAGYINDISIEEDEVGDLTRIKYSFTLKYAG